MTWSSSKMSSISWRISARSACYCEGDTQYVRRASFGLQRSGALLFQNSVTRSLIKERPNALHLNTNVSITFNYLILRAEDHLYFWITKFNNTCGEFRIVTQKRATLLIWRYARLQIVQQTPLRSEICENKHQVTEIQLSSACTTQAWSLLCLVKLKFELQAPHIEAYNEWSLQLAATYDSVCETRLNFIKRNPFLDIVQKPSSMQAFVMSWLKNRNLRTQRWSFGANTLWPRDPLSIFLHADSS